MRLFFETESQCWVFLAMVYAGLGIGVLYHGAGIIRQHSGKVGIVIMDVMVLLLAGLATAGVLIWAGQENLRLYALLGLLIGGIIYSMGIRRILHGIYILLSRYILSPVNKWRLQRKTVKFQKEEDSKQEKTLGT